MARFDWFAWHRNYRTDEWIHELSEAERWAWVAFLSYTNEYDFEVDVCKIEILAPLLTVTNVTLRSMLESAIKNGKVITDGKTWKVKNGKKYRVYGDPTAKERQAKFRESQKVAQTQANSVPSQKHESNVNNGSNGIPVYTRQDRDKTRQPPPPLNPPVAQTRVERPDRAGGGSVSLGGAEGAEGAVSFILNGSKPPEGVTPLDILQGHVSNGATVILPRLSPEQKAQMLAEREAETNRVVAEAKAKYAAERELENKHLDEKLKRDAVTWADEFAELIPNCTDQDKADIFTQIKRLSTHEWLPNMLQDMKRGIESGEVRSPKNLILYRIKNQT